MTKRAAANLPPPTGGLPYGATSWYSISVSRSIVARSARQFPDRTDGLYGKGRRFVAGLDVRPETRLLARLGAFQLDVILI